jgi:hypothetical protein
MSVKQRWALAVMGAWIAGSICSAVVATENFYTIDRLLASSPNAAFTRVVQQLGQPQARELLRYLSSELNRLYFQMWNVAQIVLGGMALWLIAGSVTQSAGSTKQDPAYTATRGADTATRRAGPSGPAGPGPFGPAGVVVLAMLATVVVMLAWLTPAIVSLGRELDFVPRIPEPPGMQRFWILHAAYTSLEMLKLAAAIVVVFWLARAGKVRLKPDSTYETTRGRSA